MLTVDEYNHNLIKAHFHVCGQKNQASFLIRHKLDSRISSNDYHSQDELNLFS